VLASAPNSGVLSSSSSAALLRAAMPTWALLSGQVGGCGAARGACRCGHKGGSV
jgi:hypothetical protein